MPRFQTTSLFAAAGRSVAAATMAAISAAPAWAQPLPGPGEEVRWTQAMSPIVIGSEITIAPGGTVIVEPGVRIEVASGGFLLIEGAMVARGEAADPITISARRSSYPQAPVAVRGSGLLDMSHCTVHGFVEADTGRVDLGQPGAAILAEDCAFDSATLRTESFPVDGPQFISVNRCTFTGAGDGLHVHSGQLVVRNSSFSAGADLRVLYGWIHTENVDIDGAPLSVTRHLTPQSLLIDDVTVTGAPEAGLNLSGWSYDLGPGNVLQGNRYPVSLAIAGLVPGAVVPPQGNVTNMIHTTAGDVVWAPMAVPYLVEGSAGIGGGLTILPGTAVKFMPGAALLAESLQLSAEGLPDAPITFQAQSGMWAAIASATIAQAPKFEHCIIEGANIGVIASDGFAYIEHCTFRGNNVGANANSFGNTFIRGSRFLDNGIGAEATDTGTIVMNGEANPNWIEGNSQGAIDEGVGDTLDARFNWWGDATGPAHTANPGGRGDPATSNVLISPFLTQPPDLSNQPPVVRLNRHDARADEGDRMLLTWQASDDRGIVAQRIEFSPYSLETEFVPIAEIPPGQQSAAVTMPEIAPSGINLPASFRVVAVDEAGREGMDYIRMHIKEPPAPLTIATDLAGPFTQGDYLGDLNTPGTYGLPTYTLEVGGVGAMPLGAGVIVQMPFVSSDLVRIVVEGPVNAFSDQGLGFSDHFTIRPDPRIGDAPPQVELAAPAGGSFPGGSTVNITWTASDDEAVRSHTVQASYDGGDRWHDLATDLPPAARSYQWRLPPLDEAFEDVQVRVITFDRRFQSSSDTSRPFTLAAGDICYPDCDASGSLDFFDFLCFQNRFAAGEPSADCDGSGRLDFFDFLCFQNEFAAGCP